MRGDSHWKQIQVSMPIGIRPHSQRAGLALMGAVAPLEEESRQRLARRHSRKLRACASPSMLGPRG